jgi:hypothetical protein
VAERVFGEDALESADAARGTAATCMGGGGVKGGVMGDVLDATAIAAPAPAPDEIPMPTLCAY